MEGELGFELVPVTVLSSFWDAVWVRGAILSTESQSDSEALLESNTVLIIVAVAEEIDSLSSRFWLVSHSGSDCVCNCSRTSRILLH